MSAEEWVYRLLLRAYPAAFRIEYGQQMMVAFHDLRRVHASRTAFWSQILVDVVRSAPSLRLERSQVRFDDFTRPIGGIMRTMAILAMIVGVLTIVNSSIEGWTGGMVNHDRLSLVAGALGLMAGVCIVSAGVMLLRRTPNAPTLAQGAAITCLAAFLLMLVISPRLSVFANILGIGFPAALVAFVQFTRSRRTPLMG